MGQLIVNTPTLAVEVIGAGEWGRSSTATETVGKLRTHPRSARTKAIWHHTTGVDADATPNTWTRAGAFGYQRRLETLRPDLGPLPYNVNAAALEDDERAHVLILEGRGLDVHGAHTRGHNVSGLACGFLGNFDQRTTARDLTGLITGAAAYYTWLHSQGFTKLGTVTPSGSREVFGHRDFKTTSCPGSTIWAALPAVRFVNPPTQEDPMEYTAARLAVVGVWARRLGSWPTGTGTETAAARLDRLARQLVTGKDASGKPYTIETLDAHLAALQPADIAARRRKFFENKAVPAWVLVEGVPAAYDGSQPPPAAGLKPGATFTATVTEV